MSEHHDDDGVPITVVEHAEWRGQGRRLYLDGRPFPYGTHAPAVLDPLIEGLVTGQRGYHVLWVPIVISGIVDQSVQATEPRVRPWDTQPVSTAPPEWADPG